MTGRTGRLRHTVRILDVLQDPDYTHWEAQRLGRGRALIGVPLIRDQAVVLAVIAGVAFRELLGRVVRA